jgi:hypothetical protein
MRNYGRKPKKADMRTSAHLRNKLKYKLRPKYRMPTDRTLVLFEQVNHEKESSFFCLFEFDVTRFDRVYINDSQTPVSLQNELVEFFYDSEGKFKFPKLYKPTRNWEHFVKCGFIY